MCPVSAAWPVPSAPAAAARAVSAPTAGRCRPGPGFPAGLRAEQVAVAGEPAGNLDQHDYMTAPPSGTTPDTYQRQPFWTHRRQRHDATTLVIPCRLRRGPGPADGGGRLGPRARRTGRE